MENVYYTSTPSKYKETQFRRYFQSRDHFVAYQMLYELNIKSFEQLSRTIGGNLMQMGNLRHIFANLIGQNDVDMEEYLVQAVQQCYKDHIAFETRKNVRYFMLQFENH